MKKKFLALITSLMLIAGLLGVMPMTVNAATNKTLNIGSGSIVFTSSGVTQNGSDVAVADSYTITGTSGNYETVSVTGGTHNITLQNATISATVLESEFLITGGIVNLTLLGSNTLSSFNGAGLQVSNGATLNILSSSTGILTANGNEFYAGIGGISNGSCGNITINGGTVNANGGAQAAGIGGSNSGGNITINGGTVNATGGDLGAGIGGGFNGKNLIIKITGGTVNATGGNRAAGIGSGLAGKDNHVEISGGTVNAIGGSGSASIGNGCNNEAQLSEGATVKITGGSVKADTMSPTPTQDGVTPVYLTAITLPSDIPANSSCAVKVDNADFKVPATCSDGRIYLYLTAAEHTVGLTYSAKTYIATATILANNTNSMTLVYAPTVSSLTVPANASYKAGTYLDFTVNFDTAVDVTGAPSLPITLNTGGTVQAAYFSGTGTTALLFRYTIVAGNTDPDGISVGSSLSLNGGTIKSKDDGIINATLTLNSVESTAGVLVDSTPPTVNSIVCADPSPTNADSVRYTVTFSEDVTGVDTYDFYTSTHGVIPSTWPISGSGSTYTITVNGISGNGTFNMNLNASGTEIKDIAGNDINGGFTGGETYTIDTIAPVVTGVTAGTHAFAVTPASEANATATLTKDTVNVAGYILGTEISTNGDYVLKVKDAAGNITTVNFTINILVITAPGAPTGVTATSNSSGAATVSFTAPTDNGGSAITGYTVTSNPGALTGTGTSTSIAVSGLTNGTSYTFTVTATNDIETSNLSTASSSVLIGRQGKDIMGFTFPTSTATIIDNVNQTVDVTVPYGTVVNGLTPTISFSNGATISPNTGISQDFTSPVTYTVTAENGTTQVYTVTVTEASATNAAAPTIVTQPQGKNVIVNGTAQLLVTASGGATLSYQWYSSSTNSNTGGNAIGGETNPTYSAPTTVGTQYYYCVVTNTDNSKTGLQTASIATDVAKVTVTNAPAANTAPTAISANQSTIIGTTLTGKVTVTDAENDPLIYALVGAPLHGTLTLNADGNYKYIPVDGYKGTDSFTFKANDGTSDSNEATITISVTDNAAIPIVTTTTSYSSQELTKTHKTTTTAVTTAETAPEPKIGGTTGWTNLEETILKAKSGETITIDMNGTTTVPQSILSDIKGKDINLVLDFGTYSWTINGKDVTFASSIDLGVEYGTKNIDADLIENFTGERSSIQLALNYNGGFGFTGTLTVKLPPEKSEYYANLYYHNPETNELEFQTSGVINADGTANLKFTHASDYVIVLDKAAMGKDISAGAGVEDNVISISQNGIPYLIACSTIATIGIAVLGRTKKVKNK